MSETHQIQGDDEEINAAIAEAQRRLPEFRRVVEEDAQRILPVYPGALVKVCVESEISGAIEHLWLEGVFFVGAKVGGRVTTAPNDLPGIEEGSELTAPTARITDWTYYDGDTRCGCFVERILMRRAGITE